MTRSVLATAALFAALQVAGSAFQAPGSVRAVVSRADLIYTAPVVRIQEGIPIGNGRIGTVVWTTPTALQFQINRIGGVVDLELAGTGADVFTIDGTHQRLSVYEGLLDVKAAGVNARMVAWPERDVIAIEVDDRRARPEPIQINLRMLRSDTARARDPVAESRITAHGGRILLSENVQEGAERRRSAVAIAVLGRRTLTRVVKEFEARIVSPAESGRVLILIATAATLDPGRNVDLMALGNLDAAAAKSFDDLAGDTAEWWHAFWQHGTVALDSPDGTAEEAADDYHYYRYLMHATVNRLTLGEGPQALEAQRLGRAAEALQLALLQIVPGVAEGDSIMRLFPASPGDWDAQFTLRARGGFTVTAAKRRGGVEAVQLRSEAGAMARLLNPWSASTVTLLRNGRRAEQLKGALLMFDTEIGEIVELRGN